MTEVAGIQSRAGERGAVSIKTILILLVLAVVVFVVIKVTPVYLEQRSLTYRLDELANKVAVRNPKPDDVRKEVDNIRKEYNLPDGSINFTTSTDTAQISLSYNRSIDFLVTTYDWKVDYKVTGKPL
jgi:Flp pilus assembly protein TadG